MNKNNVVVLTWGCTHNQKDSQLIESQLLRGGYNLLQKEQIKLANIIILNTCTVKTPTENKITYILNKYKSSNKKIVVTGCLSQADSESLRKKYPDFILLGVNAAKHILLALNSNTSFHELPVISPKHKQSKEKIEKDWIDKPTYSSTMWNKNLNIVQINEGCVNTCTFCATKFARGHLKSYSKNSIIQSIRKNITPEIWLTSQDTACWGFDNNEILPELLAEINQIDRKMWIRIGMGNPNNLYKILNQLIKAYESKKIYKFLHIPIQSGNNQVLKHMKRGYTIEEYEFIISSFKEKFPMITISTDVICGYPTETEKNFNDTINLIKRTKPSICNISRYWERNGTPAASLKQIPQEIRKKRSTELAKITQKIQLEENKKWIGWKGEILLTEIGSKGGLQGRNIYYKPIIVNNEDLSLGSWINVVITNYGETYLVGEQI